MKFVMDREKIHQLQQKLLYSGIIWNRLFCKKWNPQFLYEKWSLLFLKKAVIWFCTFVYPRDIVEPECREASFLFFGHTSDQQVKSVVICWARAGLCDNRRYYENFKPIRYLYFAFKFCFSVLRRAQNHFSLITDKLFSYIWPAVDVWILLLLHDKYEK